jgi:hypothetical protein
MEQLQMGGNYKQMVDSYVKSWEKSKSEVKTPELVLVFIYNTMCLPKWVIT